MASDAYMEISDPNVWGETYDQYFGMQGRAQGAFEIFGFEMSANSTRQGSAGSRSALALQQHAAILGMQAGAGGAPGAKPKLGGPPTISLPDDKKAVHTFTIKKFIDKASADLLLACCKAGLEGAEPMKWAIISFRESGEDDETLPFLVLEFRKLWVDSFSWSMTPGAESSSASQEESVTFAFETILIKYARQQATGEHTVIKIKGFNTEEPDKPVSEISWDSAGLPIEEN